MHSHTQSPWPAANSRRSRSPGAGRWCLSPRMYSPPRQTPVAFEPCGVFRPHAGELGLVGFSHVGMAGLEPAGLAAPSRARCQLRHIPKPSPSSPRSRSPDGPKRRMAASHAGRDSNPVSTVLETAVLAIAPPTQREASTAPCAPPPGPPDGRRDRRLPRAPSRIRTGDLPLTRRLRYHWAIGALTVPPIAFSNA